MLSENIVYYRQKNGLTQKVLADKVGISGAFMSLIESGKNEPSKENLEKIAKTLNVSVGDLKKEKATDPIVELIRVLQELTRDEKITWEDRALSTEEIEKITHYTFMNDFKSARISKSELNTTYLIIQDSVISTEDSEKYCRVSNSIFTTKEEIEAIKELKKLASLSAQNKGYIIDQLEAAKGLLGDN